MILHSFFFLLAVARLAGAFVPATILRHNGHSPILRSTTTAIAVEAADLSFRQAAQLEEDGRFREATKYFIEAKQLYQIIVAGAAERDDINSILPILAYTCVRLAHLSHDALGDSHSAVEFYRQAAKIDSIPSSVVFDGIGSAIEASGGSLQDAVDAYREAYRLQQSSAKVMFHLAVALERLCKGDESKQLMGKLRQSEENISCLVDSWDYVRQHTHEETNRNIYLGTRSMLQLGISAALPMITKDNGLVCEFGVFNGRSTRMIQEILPPGTEIHGFDTFTGIPLDWGDEPAGSYSTGGTIPDIESSVTFHKGLFADTIPPFLKSLNRNYDGNQPLAFANIDCDLYESTLDVLDHLSSRIVPGTVLVFDEYIGYETWQEDEFRAWRECCERFGWQYHYLGFSLGTKQVVIQVIA